jgi:hypothetical protein
MDTKEGIMSMNFVFDSAFDDTAKRLCHEYWSYVSPSDYIAHLELLCYEHNTETDVLFATLAKCQVYLDDVHCEYCGRPYQLDVPADIPHARRLNSWFCEGCISFSGGQLIVDR